jgi:multidrug efflux pump subunit AcrA (membrane-fusion protein)
MTKSSVDAHGSETDGRIEAERAGFVHQDGPAAQPARPASDQTEVPPVPRKRVFVAVVLVLVGLLAYGAFKHWQTDQRAVQAQEEAIDFVPEVQTITAKADPDPVKLTLPGQTAAFDQATIYPRATGYVAERHVDIGSRVKTGDLLIRIAAPDLDQQLTQAEAQLQQVQAALAQSHAALDQAKANLALANVTFKRTDAMAQRGYETVQNNDNQRTQVQSQQASVETAQAGIKVAEANVQAQQATVDRLKALTRFEEVRAPFDGIVTTRGVDTGDLVNADTKTGTPLFTVAKDRVLRVTAHIPQAEAFEIRDGLVADVYLPQRPDQRFSGRIARSSVALLNSARTLDTEVDVDNAAGALRPGAFVNVAFSIPRDHPNVVLPAEALVFNQNGLQVAVVQDDEVHMQKVSIYRDFGKTVELRDGLNGGEQIILSPPSDLGDHAKVKVKEKPPQEQAKQ